METKIIKSALEYLDKRFDRVVKAIGQIKLEKSEVTVEKTEVDMGPVVAGLKEVGQKVADIKIPEAKEVRVDVPDHGEVLGAILSAVRENKPEELAVELDAFGKAMLKMKPKDQVSLDPKQIQGLIAAITHSGGAKDVNLNDGNGKPLFSAQGALNVHVADIHENAVNDYLHRHDGVTTTLTTAIAAGDTSLAVTSVTGFVVGNHIHVLNGDNEYVFPKITDITSLVITVDSPFSNAYPTAGTSIEHIIVDLSNTAGTLSSPVIYKIEPQAGEKFHLLRMLGSITGSTPNDDGLFGGLTALTNGCVIRRYDGTTGTFGKFTTWHANLDLINDMFDVVYSDAPKQGLQGLRFRWTISKVGVAVKLDGAAGDYVEILIQDDLTALDSFTIKAQGHSDV